VGQWVVKGEGGGRVELYEQMMDFHTSIFSHACLACNQDRDSAPISASLVRGMGVGEPLGHCNSSLCQPLP